MFLLQITQLPAHILGFILSDIFWERHSLIHCASQDPMRKEARRSFRPSQKKLEPQKNTTTAKDSEANALASWLLCPSAPLIHHQSPIGWTPLEASWNRSLRNTPYSHTDHNTAVEKMDLRANGPDQGTTHSILSSLFCSILIPLSCYAISIELITI